MRKFVRRYRVTVVAGSLVAAALLAVAVVSALHAKNAETAKQEISGLLAGSYVDRAQALCEQGEVGRGMLWLADSLKIAAENSHDLDRAKGTSLSAWHGQLHSLQAVVQFPDQIRAVTFSPGRVTDSDGLWGRNHAALRRCQGPVDRRAAAPQQRRSSCGRGYQPQRHTDRYRGQARLAAPLGRGHGQAHRRTDAATRHGPHRGL